MFSPRLDRRAPSDWTHVERYPLSALPPQDTPTKAPVALGINWYSNFDNPVQQGTKWYIGHGSLGTVRGGHCVALKPVGVTDPTGWWLFYNQGSEGACVGFGTSRMMSLLNRRRYNPWWLWDQAKIADEWPSTNPGDDNGTSVHAAANVLLQLGHVRWAVGMPWPGPVAVRDSYKPVAGDGVAAVRWATNTAEVLAVLGYPADASHVCLLNSWGRDYPHGVWLPVDVLERLIQEEGEAAIVTDR